MTATQLQNRGSAPTRRAASSWRRARWLVLILTAPTIGCGSHDAGDLEPSADAAVGTGSVSTRRPGVGASTTLGAASTACSVDFEQCRTDNPQDYLSKCLPLAERCGLFTVLDGAQCATDYALCVAATPSDWTTCTREAEQCGVLVGGTAECVGEFQACVQADPAKTIMCLEIATDCSLQANDALP